MNEKLIEELEKIKESLSECGGKISPETLSDVEHYCLKIRKAASNTLTDEKELNELYSTIIISLEIIIDIEADGVIKIQIPIIAPFKKLKTLRAKPTFLNGDEYKAYELKGCLDKANAIKEPLEFELFKYKKDFKAFDYSKATILYCNYYENGQVKPDVDNYEYKQLTDTIMSVLNNGDDNNLSIMLTSGYKDHTFTEITVYPSEYIPIFKKAK